MILAELSHKQIRYIFNHGEIEDARKGSENLDKDVFEIINETKQTLIQKIKE